MAFPFGLWAILIVENVTEFSLTSGTQLPLELGVLFVLSYPFWFRAGGELAFVLFGRKPDQGGILWVFQLGDDTEGFERHWDQEPIEEDHGHYGGSNKSNPTQEQSDSCRTSENY